MDSQSPFLNSNRHEITFSSRGSRSFRAKDSVSILTICFSTPKFYLLSQAEKNFCVMEPGWKKQKTLQQSPELRLVLIVMFFLILFVSQHVWAGSPEIMVSVEGPFPTREYGPGRRHLCREITGFRRNVS